jgi:hypothetical protein
MNMNEKIFRDHYFFINKKKIKELMENNLTEEDFDRWATKCHKVYIAINKFDAKLIINETVENLLSYNAVDDLDGERFETLEELETYLNHFPALLKIYFETLHNLAKCEECNGEGYLEVQTRVDDSKEITCPDCEGSKYKLNIGVANGKTN